ncbi:MAG TPA: HIT domain-containing protein [Candidatus Microsaccharimonas sp.]|nr:HIT domain-containing protein [Candidatus Microsaccharimonas sp.]
MSDKKCPFCDVTDRVLKSNEHANVLLSNPRKVPGHFLVTPKRHVEKPWDLTKDEITDIFELIFLVEQKIIGKLGDGANIRQNYLPFINQNKVKVDHVHFHVIPRSDNDYLYTVAEQYEDGLFATLDSVEAAEVAKLLD